MSASRMLAALALSIALALPLSAQEQMTVAPAPESSPAADFDTSYRPSPSLSARIQRDFLDTMRWSAGAETRDALATAFAERAPVEIWQELVAEQGLATNNVADALTAYWVLNWITANGAYTAKIDNAPIQRQLRVAFSQDQTFLNLNDQRRQQMAENYMFDFLLEHALLNQAIAKRDVDTLNRLAAAAVARFQRNMGVNLLSLVPSAEGFRTRVTPVEE